MTRIMTPKRVLSYGGRRLHSIDADPFMLTPGQLKNGVFVYPGDVDKIELHVGDLPTLLRKELRAKGISFKRVIQYNPREPIYYSENNKALYIPVWGGELRGNRYVSMIKTYQEASGNNFEFEVVDVEDDHEKTLRNYRGFADGFVSHLARSVDFNSIDSIILGPLWAVAGALGPKVKRDALGTEYLSAQVFDIGKKVLNIGPCYSDQAKRLLEGSLEKSAALAINKEIQKDLFIYMFGTMGGLLPDMKINDLVYPTGIVNDGDLDNITLENSVGYTHPIHNILAPGGKPNNILNVSSVMDETTEQLEKARTMGCSAVEMEAYLSVATINMARIMYQGSLKPYFGLVGFVSDTPPRKTLAEEYSITDGGLAAARIILDDIRKRT